MWTTYPDLQETMSRADLVHALRQHGIDVAEFDSENDIQEVYDTDTVLAWLGY